MTIERLEYLKRIIDCRAPIINKEVNAELHSLIDAEIERQEPCDWCNGKENKLAEGSYTGLYMNGNTITAYGEGEAIVEIKYCPNCGRNLT